MGRRGLGAFLGYSSEVYRSGADASGAVTSRRVREIEGTEAQATPMRSYPMLNRFRGHFSLENVDPVDLEEELDDDSTISEGGAVGSYEIA